MVVALTIQPPPVPPITSMSPDLEMRMEGTIAEGGFSPRAEAEILFFPCGSKQGRRGTGSSTLPYFCLPQKNKLLLLLQDAQDFLKNFLELKACLPRNWVLYGTS